MKDTIGITNIYLEPYIIVDNHSCVHLDSEKKYYFGLTEENSFFLPTVDKLIKKNSASYFVDQNFHLFATSNLQGHVWTKKEEDVKVFRKDNYFTENNGNKIIYANHCIINKKKDSTQKEIFKIYKKFERLKNILKLIDDVPF